MSSSFTLRKTTYLVTKKYITPTQLRKTHGDKLVIRLLDQTGMSKEEGAMGGTGDLE